MPDQAPVVVLDGVTVRYGGRQALRGATAAFPPGATGLLGPNGAGKSTVIRSLLGLVQPESGRIHVLGLDAVRNPVAVRARVGYVPEVDTQIPGMTAISFVAYCGELSGLPRADAIQRAHEVLFHVGLGDARYRAVDTYSTGMKQRVKLAQALVHDPDLLFLDEPTNGMDPRGRDEMLALIRDLADDKGISLILSSHLLPDVEATCDHVVVLESGQVVAQGTLQSLKPTQGQMFELRIKATDGVDRFLGELQRTGCTWHDSDDDLMRVFVPGAGGARELFVAAAASGVQVRHLRPSIPTLDDALARVLGDR